MDKQEIRRSVREVFRSVGSGELERLSGGILDALTARVEAVGPGPLTILLYWSLPDEVPTHNFADCLREAGHTVLLPVVTDSGLVLRVYSGRGFMSPGEYGIQEPQGEDFTGFGSIDLAFVPGRAFSPGGARVGRGKACYDRLLPSLSCPKIGVCFPFQLFDALPEEKHDVHMDEIISA